MSSSPKIQKLFVQKGFSLPELLVVLLILAIILALALPQIISSRQLFTFSNMERQMVASIRDARQAALTQRTSITVNYDDSQKLLTIYGGSFGSLKDSRNQIVNMIGGGLGKSDIVYGRPSGVSSKALNDGVNLTALAGNKIEFTFQSDGSILNSSGNPENFGLYFYHNKYPNDTAYALTILGSSGRVKLWRYSQGIKDYVE